MLKTSFMNTTCQRHGNNYKILKIKSVNNFVRVPLVPIIKLIIFTEFNLHFSLRYFQPVHKLFFFKVQPRLPWKRQPKNLSVVRSKIYIKIYNTMSDFSLLLFGIRYLEITESQRVNILFSKNQNFFQYSTLFDTVSLFCVNNNYYCWHTHILI